MDLIPNDGKHLNCTENSQKSLLKTFYYNNKGTRKVKDFRELSNKEIYFILQSNSTKYNKPFKFISCSNFLEGHHVLSPEIWGKTFSDWFKKCYDGYILCILAIHRKGNTPDILYPRCNELFNFKHNLVFRFRKLRDTATELGSKETFLKTWNSLLSNN